MYTRLSLLPPLSLSLSLPASLFLCVYERVCVCLCVHEWVPAAWMHSHICEFTYILIYVNVQARAIGLCWLVFSITLYFMHLRQCLSLNGACWFGYTDWPASSGNPPVSLYLPNARLQVHVHKPFYLDSGDQIPLPTEASLRAQWNFWLMLTFVIFLFPF